MNRQDDMKKYFNSIMELKGADEFKEMIRRLHTFLKNREAYSLTDVTLPNYLWVTNRGGGITTMVNLFAEYLYAARAVEFCGTVKVFEFKLDYIAPDAFFSELARLDNTIASFAGHNRFYKGLICINIDEWMEHTGDDHFKKFMNYISSNNDRLLVIFCVHSDAKKFVEAIESVISSHLRLESLALRFPDANELVEHIETRYIQNKGFSFTNNAKALLCDTISELAAGKQFNGFKSIKQLANDILYNILATDLGGNQQISAEMLSCYEKGATYVKRANAQTSTKSAIGFTGRSV